jgi:hypothetical protein
VIVRSCCASGIEAAESHGRMGHMLARVILDALQLRMKQSGQDKMFALPSARMTQA